MATMEITAQSQDSLKKLRAIGVPEADIARVEALLRAGKLREALALVDEVGTAAMERSTPGAVSPAAGGDVHGKTVDPLGDIGPSEDEIVNRVLQDIRKDPMFFSSSGNYLSYRPFSQYNAGLSNLPKGAVARIDQFLGSSDFTDLVIDAQIKAGRLGGSGPPGGNASFVTDNRPNTQYKVLNSTVFDGVSVGQQYNLADFHPEDRPRLQAAISEYQAKHPPVPGMVPGGGGNNAGISPTGSGVTPNPVTGVVSGGGGTNAGISPPGGRTIVDPVTGVVPGGGGTNAGISPPPAGGVVVDPVTGVVPGGGGTNAGISPPPPAGSPGPGDLLEGAPGAPKMPSTPKPKISLSPSTGPITDLGVTPPSPVPALYGKAAAKAGELLDQPFNQEEYQQQYDFGVRPYKEQFEKEGKEQVRQAIAQGLWWSGDRENAIFENLGKFSDRVAQNVTVPLITQRQNDQRANIDLAARVGRGEFDIGQAAKTTEGALKASEAGLTGQYQRGATSAADLGVDVSRIYRADGSADMDEFGRATEELQARFREVMGREGTQSELQTLIRGGRIQGAYVPTLGEKSLGLEAGALTGTYQGQDTLERQRLFGFDRDVTNADGTVTKQHVYGANEVQLALQNNDQNFQVKLAQGWNYVDENGQPRRVLGTDERITEAWEREELTRTGYDQPVIGADGKPLVDKDGKPLMKHIEGTQELSARLADREAELREQGMKLEDAHFKANQEWEQRKYTGFYQIKQVTAKDLGLSGTMDLFTRADGSADYDAFFAWADNPNNSELYARLRGALGRTPTADDLNRLINGEGVALTDAGGLPIVDWVNGTVGLEKARNDLQITLQQHGIDADEARQKADQDYQDKVRNGYLTTDPRTGQSRYIYGTQEFSEMSEERQRQFVEDQRVGYDKVITTSHWDAAQQKEVKTTRTIHVQGTQEAAKAQADAAANLTREGWDAQAAQNEADRQQQANLEWGYFRTVETPTGPKQEWVPGRQEHQTSLQGLQNDLVERGWSAEMARDEAQYVRSMATEDAGFLRQTYIKERAWYYQNVGVNGRKLDAAAAFAKAEQDWGQVEGSFEGGKTLTERLEQMQLDAAENRFDAETARQDRAMIIEAVAGIVGIAGKEFLLNLFPDDWSNPLELTEQQLRDAGITDQGTIDRILGVTGGGAGAVAGWTQGAGGVWRNADGSTWSEADGWVDATGHGRNTAGQAGPWNQATATPRWGEQWTQRWAGQTGKQKFLSFLGGGVTGLLQSEGQNTQAYADWKAQNPYKAALLDVSGGVASFFTNGPWGVLAWAGARMFNDDPQMPSWVATVDPFVSEGLVDWSKVPNGVAATSTAQVQTRITFDYARGEVHYLRGGMEVGKESFADFQKNQGLDLIPLKAWSEKDPDLKQALDDMPKGTTHVAVKRDGTTVRLTYINGSNGSTTGRDTIDNYEPMFNAYLGKNKTVATRLENLDRTLLRRVATRGSTETLPAEYVGLWQSIPNELKNPAAGDSPRPATMAADLMDWSGMAGAYDELDPLTGKPRS